MRAAGFSDTRIGASRTIGGQQGQQLGHRYGEALVTQQARHDEPATVLADIAAISSVGVRSATSPRMRAPSVMLPALLTQLGIFASECLDYLGNPMYRTPIEGEKRNPPCPSNARAIPVLLRRADAADRTRL